MYIQFTKLRDPRYLGHTIPNNVYLMHHKSEALEKFKEYKVEVENLLGKIIKTFRSDRGGEYMDLNL